jgi:CP family cyanate transporter-like MFS transporter
VSATPPETDRRVADDTAARLAPIAALFIVALALRPQVSAIGPLADSITTDLGVGYAFVGLLTAIPVVCMGLFEVVGPALAPVTGVRAGIAISVAVLLVFAILRALVPGAIPLVLFTFGVGVGTGIVGPLLSMFVRGRLPAHAVAGTAAYAGGTITGAALGSGVIVPLEALFGDWHEALLAVSLLSCAALVAWLLLVRRLPGPAAGDRPPRRVTRPKLPVRRPIAWLIGILFAMQSWLFYGTIAWLAPAYGSAAGRRSRPRGWSPSSTRRAWARSCWCRGSPAEACPGASCW